MIFALDRLAELRLSPVAISSRQGNHSQPLRFMCSTQMYRHASPNKRVLHLDFTQSLKAVTDRELDRPPQRVPELM